MGKNTRRNKRNKKPKIPKITNERLTLEMINSRSSTKFGDAKWMEFARHFIAKGVVVELYEARQTFSKYLTVINGEKRFKVRFSNHKPIASRELAGDCDYFVGHTNLGITRTDQAIMATEIALNI